jgi:YidC/Oxa1 family membrane protein insertase
MLPIFANVLQPLIDVFESIMKFFHDSFGFSWGWSIIAMTVVVRAAMLPLTIKQFRSMASLQQLKPEIDKLRAKYGDDKQRLNQEMMSFYQENKVNPFGSCLPLVLQLPVFISLFYMLRKDLRYDICPQVNDISPGVHNTAAGFPKACGAIPDASFLGIPDITSKATGATLIILLVLYVGSQLFSSLLMQAMTPSVDKNQRLIMLVLPFVFVPFVIGFPAGLMVYWITTNLWTMGQQFTIRKTIGHRMHVAAERAAADAAAGIAPPPAPANEKKSGGLFSNLMARAQQAQAQPSNGAAAKDGAAAKGGDAAQPAAKKPAPAAAPAAGTPRRGSAPPPSPRKKKKRSGRRR